MYAKLFQSILQSSIWSESPETCKVWITMLALADEDGMVMAGLTGIAHEARLDKETTADALKILSSPDPDSRTPDNEGRRVEAVPGGYLILNYKSYRNLQNTAERRKATRERVARHRQKVPVTQCNDCNDCNTNAPNVTHTDTDTEADAKTNTKAKKDNTPPAAADVSGIESKPQKVKRVNHDPFADAYKAAFDKHWPEPYSWQAGDFVHLTEFKKNYPAVTPERFAAVAVKAWQSNEKYKGGDPSRIRGLCTAWAQIVAIVDKPCLHQNPRMLQGVYYCSDCGLIYDDDMKLWVQPEPAKKGT